MRQLLIHRLRRALENFYLLVRLRIAGGDLSNPKNEKQYLNGIKQGALEGEKAHHFDMARHGAEADKKNEQTGDELKEQGVK